MDPDRRTKRARLQPIEQVAVDCSSEVLVSATQLEQLDEPVLVSKNEASAAPSGFLCPLTMMVMYDPVLDTEGNTYERSAISEWLQRKKNSPVSRQPLSESMLIPNLALRETIHESMGSEWVAQKEKDFPKIGSPSPSSEPASFRDKIDSYLQHTGDEIGGLNLRLDDQGYCAFRYDEITVILYVPEKVGIFCFYTRELVPKITESMKDRLLELNYLQGETKGGCLSTKRHDDGHLEVLFSYSDRVPQVSATDFRTILYNFVITATSLRWRLLLHAKADDMLTYQMMMPTFLSQDGVQSNEMPPPA